MRRLLSITVAMLALLSHLAGADDRPLKGDLGKLQGVWKGKTGRGKSLDSVITFKGNSGTTESTISDGRKMTATYKFTIDEDAKPHKTMSEFDFVRSGSGGGAARLFSIYKFVDDNTVMFCHGTDKYPAEFKEGENGSPIIYTLKRMTEKNMKEK